MEKGAESTKRREGRLRFALLLLAFVLPSLALGHFLGAHDIGPGAVADWVKQRIEGRDDPERPPGVWGRSSLRPVTAGLTPEQRSELVKLQSLGYTSGSMAGPKGTGVVAHDEKVASRGLRLWISGHSPGAVLMSTDGTRLHRWSYDYRDVWRSDPERYREPADNGTADFWRRVHLYPDGSILVIFQGYGLIKVDRDSRLIWSRPGYCHHHLIVDPGGRIHVLTSESGIVSRIHETMPVRLDDITILDPDGELLRRISIYEAFENSDYAPFLAMLPPSGDIMHTNTLRLLDGSLAHLSPYFAQGNYLISVREMNVVAILDPRTERIVWATAGMWHRQHDPILLPDGMMLLFDNLGNGGRSRVIEFDPFTREIVWRYGEEPGQPLFSETQGTVQRLANDNTLITESNNGRVIEVTPAGRIAWEYHNPHRAGGQDEWIAVIPDMIILPEGYLGDWTGR